MPLRYGSAKMHGVRFRGMGKEYANCEDIFFVF